MILDELIDVKTDGSIHLNMKYFAFTYDKVMTNQNFSNLFEIQPRKEGQKMEEKYYDIAASAQLVLEDILLKMAEHVHKKTKKKNLCLGGGVALFSGWLPLIEKITDKVKFAAHLSIYPPCIVEPEVLSFTDSPIHIMIGALDDWVPAAACEELVPKIKNSGANIGLTVYSDSHHSFDKDMPLSFKENAYRTVDCRFKMNKDGALLMNFLSIPMTTPLRQKIGLYMCADRGTTMGGNPKTRKEAFKFARQFMSDYLLTND